LKTYPALRVRSSDADCLAAAVDDYSPTAIESRDDEVRVFFANARNRDAAHRALAARFDVSPIEVSDQDWARRSQENLPPVTVGRLTVFPNPESRIPNPNSGTIALVIAPSMGFGTGHHATTRLCLEALQTIDVRGRTALDVGTGSGILAIAAARLGAARARGIDSDADAIQSARENLAVNPGAAHVTFDVADLATSALGSADVVTANLTGALLVRSASRLTAAVRQGGVLIVGGLLAHERDEVRAAFRGTTVVWEREDEGWASLVMKK
jgi:ribosomal protein L11 methyltransferase